MEFSEKHKRLKELALRSETRNIFTFTPFLSPSTLADIDFVCGKVDYQVWGGTEWAERKMVRFGNSAEIGYEQDFPLTIVKISPTGKKFVSTLTHRDYLGALLGLGIERDAVGDIFVKDNEGYAVVSDDILPLLTTELNSVGRASVNVEKVAEVPVDFAPVIEELSTTVSSLRADCVICRAFNLSREQSLEYFRAHAVAINGKREDNASKLLVVGDTVTVKGCGKFTFISEDGLTKKDKRRVIIGKYSTKTN